MIGVDVDETLFPTLPLFIKWHNVAYGTKVELSQFDSYSDWSVLFEVSVPVIVQRFLTFMKGDYLDLNPKPFIGASDTLTRFKSDGLSLGIVTSRQGELSGVTVRQIDLHFEDRLLFKMFSLGNKYARQEASFCEKWEQCQRFGIKLMIEDNPDDANKLSAHGIHVILFNDMNTYPWGIKESNNKMIHTVSSWEEVYPVGSEIVKQLY